jgi:hypothetical protein
MVEHRPADLVSQPLIFQDEFANHRIGESFAGRLTAFDIDAAGSLSNRRVSTEGLAPDAESEFVARPSGRC